MHLSSRKGWRVEAKCYRRDGRQGAWNFHSQHQEICAESQSRFEDPGAHSEENSSEKTAVLPVQTATGTKTPAWWGSRFVRTCWAGWKRIRVCPNGSFLVMKRLFLSGKVNRHNTRIRGSQNTHALTEMEHDSPKVNVFCAISRRRVFGPFFFVEDSVTGKVYLDMLENWLMPQLADEEVQGAFTNRTGPHHVGTKKSGST